MIGKITRKELSKQLNERIDEIRNHSQQHALEGNDPITPEMIGALTPNGLANLAANSKINNHVILHAGNINSYITPPTNYENEEVTYYVAPNGNDSNNGSQVAPFRTIGKAFAVIKNIGAKARYINVAGGNYNEALRLEEFHGGSITLLGDYQNKPRIRSLFFERCTSVIQIANVNIAGSGVGGGTVLYGLYFDKCNLVSFSAGTISGCSIGARATKSYVHFDYLTINNAIGGAIDAYDGSFVTVSSLSGSGNNYVLSAVQSIMMISHVTATGTTAEFKGSGGQIFK